MKQHAKHLGQRSFRSKVIIWRYRYTYSRSVALPSN